MSVNSSSNSSNSFLHLSPEDCIKSKPSIFIFKAFYITGMLLTLPLIILVLFVGLQRWKKQRSISTAATSHSDFFTYNMVAMELIKFVGACFYWYGAYTDVHSVKRVGKSLYVLTSPGQTMFHILTCAERYLAVVHPITYMRLRQGGGVRIRNISSGCIWLLCFASLGLNKLLGSTYSSITISCFVVFSLIVVSFFSLSVLCVLIHSGPREMGGASKQVDQSKQRAFHIIVAIQGALVLRFVGILIHIVIGGSTTLTPTECVVEMSAVWLTLPCSLVLPLLFLHRAGKLPSCKHNTESG